MGWLTPKYDARVARCECLGRPRARTEDNGRVWACDACGRRWQVRVVFYEPWDINPGESASDVYWVAAT